MQEMPDQPKDERSGSTVCSLAVALLEQHRHYGIDDRWAIGKNREDGQWCLYYGNKHIDAWRMEADGNDDFFSQQYQDGLSGFDTAEKALLEFEIIKESNPPWLVYAKEKTDSLFASLPS